MNTKLFEQGQAAYSEKDFRTAARLFLDALEPGTPIGNGPAFHMAGNAFMQLGRFNDAVTVFQNALRDDGYNRRSAIESNLAASYVQTGDYSSAITHYELALTESDCKAPYKCYQGLANAYMEQHKFEQAAYSYKKAALDGTNPDPGKALVNLGLCLMALSRPEAAVEAYRAALGCDTYQNRGKALANLGVAHHAAGHWPEAVRTLEEAKTLHKYELSAQARAILADARCHMEGSAPDDDIEAVTAEPMVIDDLGTIDEPSVEAVMHSPSTELVSAPKPESISIPAPELVPNPAPEDGFSAFLPETDSATIESLVPDPPQSAPAALAFSDNNLSFGEVEDVEQFFAVSENELKRKGKEKARSERKPFGWLKPVLIIVVILGILGGTTYGLYMSGYGMPAAETTVSDLMNAYNTGEPLENMWATGSINISREMAAIPTPGTFKVDSVAKGTEESVASVTVTPNQGAPLKFKFTLVREGLGWKILALENEF